MLLHSVERHDIRNITSIVVPYITQVPYLPSSPRSKTVPYASGQNDNLSRDYMQKKRDKRSVNYSLLGMQYQTLYVSIREEPSDKA